MSEDRNLLGLTIQQPPANSLFPTAPQDGQQYLSQGPMGPLSITQSIDPHLAFLHGTAANQALQQTLARGMEIGTAAGPGQFGTFHGTGAAFSQFLDEFMGTGEGAQAYGWGHYVAQSPGVAKTYRPDPEPQILLRGQPWKYSGSVMDSHIDNALETLHGNAGDMDKTIADFKTNVSMLQDRLRTNPPKDPSILNDINDHLFENQDALSWLNANRHDIEYKSASPGHLLNVWVKPEHEDFLDWDLPFSQQGSGVQDKLKGLYRRMFGIGQEQTVDLQPHVTGREIYNGIGGFLGPNGTEAGRKMASDYGKTNPGATYNEITSKVLDQAGIPGNRFLDQQSRGKPVTDKSTYNYVVFDPKNLEITHMDGTKLTPVDHDPFAPGGTP